MKWIEASAPSNIALIKYMGKLDSSGNKPTNASLSWTLEKLRTYVRIQKNPLLTTDTWKAYQREDLRPIELSLKGQEKFLNFFDYLKKEFKLTGFYEIESANNFPSDCGLASSASSFAALTTCAHQVYLEESEHKSRPYLSKELSRLSQKGSGSSCRSFFTPWSLWHDVGAEEIKLPVNSLRHMVILCDETVKSVSSSEAHKLVLTSELFKGRPERAQERLQNLISAARSQDWAKMCKISWNEFWDMHTLFHTSNPTFMYMNGDSLFVLNYLQRLENQRPERALITMDAGSNIHLLIQPSDEQLYKDLVQYFSSYFNIWTDEGLVAKC